MVAIRHRQRAQQIGATGGAAMTWVASVRPFPSARRTRLHSPRRSVSSSTPGAVQAPIGGVVIGAGQGMDPRRAHADRGPERVAQRRQSALVRDAVTGEISGHIGGSDGRRTVAGKRVKV